ncbi:PhoX family phosphatase [Agromyces sp. S2-1-8]|uniref:PhoX family protein n=1 Tax=Agromyces sp. S2-1-8 TaxID=2897180 RepID=UPI001E47BA6E|nr:PhoX family phosphatase [Agromyces sp. S2-1-8]MCD5347602.1 PhoX family phosphatase [Agromyces sp. S2-1-8]
MADHVRGKRSAVTCHFKCANACIGPECNTTTNAHFRDVASAALTRRALLGFGAAGAVGIALAAASPSGSAFAAPGGGASGATGGLPFDAIDPVPMLVDDVTVPAGYTWQPIIRWGDPLFSSVPALDFEHQTPEAQAGQFGYNCDYLDILQDRSGRTGVLVNNHEYVNPAIMFAPSTDAAVLDERAAIAKAAHGFSVVELRRSKLGQPWRYLIDGRRNRRITADTVFEVTGPAAGSVLLQTAEDAEGRWVKGTLGNCAGGTTPWGTVLSGEENFDGYFVWAADTAGQKRYRATPSTKSTYTFERIDPRFNAKDPGFVNEPNRFGWIVEIDPEDPTSTPRKHTAMGRFKHEGANVIIGEDGRAVAYMGDDQANDYMYKFVSKRVFDPSGSKAARRRNMTLLEEGDLYVAKFTGDSPAAEITGTGALPSDGAFDGSGVWIPLTQDGESVIPGMSTEEVLVYTRLAADTVGATKMDRPEDVQPNPRTGKVYAALTNNSGRTRAQVDEANPVSLVSPTGSVTGNRHGHVLELTETAGQSGTTFGWTILLLCGDPSIDGERPYFSGFPAELVSPISCPDNIAFDSVGDLWISTDGAPSKIGYNDGLFKVGLEGEERGRVQQFLSVPRDAETCGPVIHDREGMVFVAVQHPGEEGTVAEPHSYFPDYVPTHRRDSGLVAAPRPSVIQVWRG